MVTFEQQIREPSLRQQYLEEVDFGSFAPFIRDIRYVHEENEICSMGFIYEDKKIVVYSNAYLEEDSTGETEGNFLSGLVDHEGKHAEQHTKIFQFKIRSLIENIKTINHYGIDNFLEMSEIFPIDVRYEEMEAYANQLKKINSGERKVTIECRSDIEYFLNFYSHAIMKDTLKAKRLAFLMDSNGNLNNVQNT